ncbi:MAG TPA: hypothetical protein VFS20_06590 [Longimicrobium sp.]|nr:hypothetical protein [Longimicrobium sp.]
MKKLRLDAEDLQVESFPTDAAAALRGTVEANSAPFCGSAQDTCWNMGCRSGYSAPEYCPTAADETCPGWPGCNGSSDAGGYSCDNTCSDYGCTACGALC